MRISVAVLGLLLGACSAPGPVDELGQVREAAHLLKAGEVDRAEEILRSLVRAHPLQALGHQVLAHVFLHKSRLDSARAHYARAAELDSLLADARLGLGLVDTYEGAYERACERFLQAIELDAGNPAYHYNAGLVYEYRGMHDTAHRAFSACVRIDPWNTAARRKVGGILLRQNRADEAMEQYAAACRIDPLDADNWRGAGTARAHLGHDSLAVACLERARDLGADSAELFYELGMLYREMGQMAAAAKSLRRFEELREQHPLSVRREQLKLPDPDPGTAQHALGRLYARRGRAAAAEARFWRARRLGYVDEGADQTQTQTVSGDDEARTERLAGLEAMRAREYGLALGHYRVAVRLAPASAVGHRGLGLALALLERHDAAVAQYEEAVRLDPQGARAHNDLAVLCADQRGDYERAIASLQVAIASEPGERLYRYNLGHLHLARDERTLAASAFERALELDSTWAPARHSLEMARAERGGTREAEQGQDRPPRSSKYRRRWLLLAPPDTI